MSQSINQPSITPRALWTWQQTATSPIIQGYPPGGINQPTKTGIMPSDLQAFVGVPLVYQGGTPVPVPASTQIQWIRWAEDYIERECGILLCQTYVAAPPLVVPGNAFANSVAPANGAQEVLGVDYDLPEAAYDFYFPRAEDSGWMAYQLRYRPVKMVSYSNANFSAIQRYAFEYPLLNEFFQVPPTWLVTDEDFGFVRIVPATNIQMLPLFALYLGFLAFTDSLPGGLQLHYVAGLTPPDMQTRYSFIPQLVLAQTAITALSLIQGTLNTGFTSFDLKLDSLEQKSTFNNAGPYAGLIKTFTAMRDSLLQAAISKVGGPSLTFL